MSHLRHHTQRWLCVKTQWMASRFHKVASYYRDRTLVGAEQPHDSPCVISTQLKEAKSGLNHAVKLHNHNSALKETNRFRTHSTGDV